MKEKKSAKEWICQALPLEVIASGRDEIIRQQLWQIPVRRNYK
jgi:hypothetical protein